MRLKQKYLLVLGLGLYLCLQAGGIAWSQVTERVSVDSAGNEANGASTVPSTSNDGRFVAFESKANNLVAGDILGFDDIFVHDRQTAITTRVSVDSGGAEGSGHSYSPSISGDGRYVAFESNANLDLVAGDSNPLSDIFVHELLGGTTTLVSVDSFGVQDVPSSSFSPSISADGRYVAFESDAILVANDLALFDVYVHDRQTGDTILVSVDSLGAAGNNNSKSPSISADGRYVAFESFATNLVAGDNNGLFDVFVHDRDADEDGIYDDEDGTYDPGEVSTVRVSVRSDGTEADQASNAPSISSDGRYVAFESNATNLVADDTNVSTDIFVHDRDTDGDGIYDEPGATNLVADDTNGSTDVFVHDLQTGATTRVSVDLAGFEDIGDSNNPSISADGSSVTFQSDADNLVAGDTNTAPDIFADDLQTGAGQVEGSGDGNSGGGCFIATAADGSVVTKEK